MSSRPPQSPGGLASALRRTASGSQTDSFVVALASPAPGVPPVHAVFIRAPVVDELGDRATALSALDDGRVVAVEQGKLLGTSFHPEITND